MLVICHDEIDQDPIGSLCRICEFLAIDSSPSGIPSHISDRVDTQAYPAVPPGLAAELAHHLYPSLLRLHEQLKTPYTLLWLERAKALQEGGR